MYPPFQTRQHFISQGADLGLRAARFTSVVYTVLMFLFADFLLLQSYFQSLSDRGENFTFEIDQFLLILFSELISISIAVFLAMFLGVIVGSVLGLLFSLLVGRVSPRGFALIGLLLCLSFIISLYLWAFSRIGWAPFAVDDALLTSYLFYFGFPQLVFVGCGGWVGHQLVKINQVVLKDQNKYASV